MKKVLVGNRIIGDGYPTLIVAEAGVNHNGNLELAKKLIDIAVDAKADVVKFQKFKAEKLATKDAKMASYQHKNIGKNETQYSMLKKLELKDEDYKELIKYANKKGIMFLCTPFDEESADFLHNIGMKFFKISSTDTTNLPFLEHIAKKGLPIILSTGMSNLDDVKKAVNLIKKYNKNLIVLHCTTDYPSKIEDVNLRAMNTIKNECNVLVGYSDHTEGIIVPQIAVAHGAVVIEKHFTLDKNLPGPDHKASLNPSELKEMVKAIRHVEKILGSHKKDITKSEKEIMKIARKSLVAAVNIKKGSLIKKEMLIIKRPGYGISPIDINKILGKKVVSDIKKDELIKFEKLK